MTFSLVDVMARDQQLRTQLEEIHGRYRAEIDHVLHTRSVIMGFLTRQALEAKVETIEPMVRLRRGWDAERDVLGEQAQKELKVYADAVAALDQAMLAFLNRTGQTSAKTESGTAYTVTKISFTAKETWDTMINFLLEALLDRFGKKMEEGATEEEALAEMRLAPELNLLNRSVNATAVKEFMEQHEGALPPGVTSSGFTSLHVRKPD